MSGIVSTMSIALAKLLWEYSPIFDAMRIDPIFVLMLSYPIMFTHTTIIIEQKRRANWSRSSAKPISAPEMLMLTHIPMPKMRNWIISIRTALPSLARYRHAKPKKKQSKPTMSGAPQMRYAAWHRPTSSVSEVRSQSSRSWYRSNISRLLHSLSNAHIHTHQPKITATETATFPYPTATMNALAAPAGHTRSNSVLSSSALNTTNRTIGAETYSSTASIDAMKSIASGIAVSAFTARRALTSVMLGSNASTIQRQASQNTAAMARNHAMA